MDKQRYIDLNKLIARLLVLNDNGEYLVAISDVRRAISLAQAETGEVVEVVAKTMAETLYNAGYRKHNAWISVTDKNPEDVYGKDREKITVLVCTRSGKVSASTRCARYSYNRKQDTWVKTGEFKWSGSKEVTHWMPFPEPPKG